MAVAVIAAMVPVVAPAPQASKPARVVARVAGETITSDEAFDAVLFHFREQGLEVVKKLAGDAILRAEARKRGVAPDPVEVERGVVEGIKTLGTRVDTEFGASMTLDRFLESEMRTTRAEYEQLLRAFVAQSQLAALLIRFDEWTNERVSLRHIAVRDAKTAAECIQKLRDGADFATLARDVSVAATKGEGGKVPPFDRELRHPMTAAAFDAPVGTVGGPVFESRGEEKMYHIFKVIEKIPARNVAFDAVKAELYRDITKNPPARFEFEAFMRKAASRHPSEVFGLKLEADPTPGK